MAAALPPSQTLAARSRRGSEALTIFRALCMRAFPSREDEELYASGARLHSLAGHELAEGLQSSYGRGWKTDRGATQYVLTIDAPPANACSLLQTTSRAAAIRAPEDFEVELAKQAAAMGGELDKSEPQRRHVVGVGIVTDQAYAILQDEAVLERYLVRTTLFDRMSSGEKGGQMRLTRALISAHPPVHPGTP